LHAVAVVVELDIVHDNHELIFNPHPAVSQANTFINLGLSDGGIFDSQRRFGHPAPDKVHASGTIAHWRRQLWGTGARAPSTSN